MELTIRGEWKAATSYPAETKQNLRIGEYWATAFYDGEWGVVYAEGTHRQAFTANAAPEDGSMATAKAAAEAWIFSHHRLTTNPAGRSGVAA